MNAAPLLVMKKISRRKIMPAKKTPTKKTTKEKLVIEQIVEQVQQVEFETFEEAFERVAQVEQAAIAQSDSQQLILAEEQTVEQKAITQPSIQKKNYPARSIPQAREQFDLNLVVVSGVIGSVWGKNNDVFARLALSLRGRLVENDDTFASYVTVRFADGMIGGVPISIQPGDVLKIQGYLVHREYQETLRKFLDEANAMSFLNYVDPADLSAWRLLTLERRNGLVNALAMSLLDGNGKLIAHFGEPIHEKSLNRAQVEGIVARVWEYRHDEGVDLFARIAVYDEHTPIDSKRAGNFGRARRAAHYITVRFSNGKTSSGAIIRLQMKMRIRVVGELRDKAQVVTLRDELLRTGSSEVAAMMQRMTDAGQLSEIKNQQESLHVLASAVVVYSSSGK
jgi:hypothetical protein